LSKLHFTGRLPWQPQSAGIKFTQCFSRQNQNFRPCRKNYALDRKMIAPVLMVSTFSITVQSLGERWL